jgi:flagella basal body P-ring formation protein FlgA
MSRPPPVLILPALAVAVLAALTSPAATAQTLVAARAIARGEVLTPEALALRPGPAPPGALSDPAAAAGRTARRALAPGAVIRADALAAPLAVRRGEPVVLRARVGGARIEAPGLAEADAPAGAPVSARNAATGARVRGRAAGPGLVDIGP